MYFSSLTSCFFPRSQPLSWLPVRFPWSPSGFLPALSLSADHSSGSGTLKVSVSQRGQPLSRCPVWRIFYSGDPFSLILLTLCPFLSVTEFPFWLSWELWSWRWLCLAGHFLLAHPLSRKRRTCPWQVHPWTAASFKDCELLPLPASSPSFCVGCVAIKANILNCL